MLMSKPEAGANMLEIGTQLSHVCQCPNSYQCKKCSTCKHVVEKIAHNHDAHLQIGKGVFHPRARHLGGEQDRVVLQAMQAPDNRLEETPRVA